jgi:hypothetical protein
MKTLNFIRHLWETEKLFLFFVFIVLVCSIGIIFIYPNFKKIWEDEINAPIAIVTVLVSIFIWRNQKKLAYEDQLPKKLDITFIWEDQEWKIKNAPLTDVSDIRPWAQSIGGVVLGKPNNVALSGFEIDQRGKQIQGKLHYRIKIYMTKKFDSDVKSYYEFDDNGRLISTEN